MTMRLSRLLPASAFASMLLSLVTPAFAEPPAARVPEPEVPAELAAKGTVYHTISGRQAQVTFTSDAPLQNIVGKSNAVVGYAVAGPADAPASLAGGRWILPIASLATGIPLRDEHLAGDHWLDAADHPNIEFLLEKTESAEQVKSGADFSTWTATLVGTMEMHGVKKPLRIEKAKISFLKASERTATIAPGDLVFIQCGYEVKLSDFGIRNDDVPGKVSDTIRLDQLLRLSTVKVEPGSDKLEVQDAGAKAGGAAAPAAR